MAAIPIPATIHDKTGRLLCVSRGWADLSGYGIEEIPTMSAWAKAASVERRDLAEDYIGQLFSGGSAADCGEWLITTKNGSKRVWHFMTSPLNMSKGPSLLLSTAVDVTEWKRVEEALRQTEERLRQGVRVAALGIFEHDHVTDDIYWSPEMRAICGWGPSQTVTLEGWIQGVHPDDRNTVAQSIRNAHDPEGHGLYDIEHRIVLSDGRVRWVRIKSQTFFEAKAGSGRRPLRTIGAVLNVTEHKLAEQEREQLLIREQELRTAAESANRLKDEFLSTVSHELRTPLTSIIGFMRLIRAGRLRPEQVQNALDVIERNSELQAKLVDDLLDLARMMTGKLKVDFESVDLLSVINAAVETVSSTAVEKGLTIETDLQPTRPVSGSPDRLRQIFFNLLSNAIKFTESGGRIYVQLNTEGMFAKASVRDTGVGIHQEFLPFVFGRFRQADASTTRKHGGLGLGLAIAHQLVEAHDGTIQAHSDGPGLGATFTVRLPFAAQGELHRNLAKAKREIGHDLLAGVKALVVEDDADSREVITVSLETSGASVTAVDSCQAALEALRQHPDIVLIDIGMADYNGYTLLAKIRGMGRDLTEIPAIAVTAYASDSDRDAALAAGFQAHVRKPFAPNDLVRVVADFAVPKSGAA